MSKSYRLVWTEAATGDLEEIIDYLAHDRGVAHAETLFEKLRGEVSKLETLPPRCRIVPELKQARLPMFRELIVFPYRVMFRVRGRDVVLLSIFDGRRDLDELLLSRAVARSGL